MKRFTLAVSAVLMGASFAYAGDVAPGDVKFDDYGAVEASLTGKAGDPVAGREVFVNRKLGNCLACHANSDLADQPFHGEVGPPLDGVADRWSEAEIRGIVSNAKMTFEGTIMPAFYVNEGFTRVREQSVGKTILEAQQIEDVVAYLLTLKE